MSGGIDFRQNGFSATTASGQSSSGAHVGSGSGSGSGGASAGPALPATGTYQLAVDGGEHVKFGPFSACSNTFPKQSSLVIQPASGEPSGSYDFDLRFYPNNANKHDERHIYRYTNDSVFLSYEQATVTCGGVKQSSKAWSVRAAMSRSRSNRPGYCCHLASARGFMVRRNMRA